MASPVAVFNILTTLTVTLRFIPGANAASRKYAHRDTPLKSVSHIEAGCQGFGSIFYTGLAICSFNNWKRDAIPIHISPHYSLISLEKARNAILAIVKAATAAIVGREPQSLKEVRRAFTLVLDYMVGVSYCIFCTIANLLQPHLQGDETSCLNDCDSRRSWFVRLRRVFLCSCVRHDVKQEAPEHGPGTGHSIKQTNGPFVTDSACHQDEAFRLHANQSPSESKKQIVG